MVTTQFLRNANKEINKFNNNKFKTHVNLVLKDNYNTKKIYFDVSWGGHQESIADAQKFSQAIIEGIRLAKKYSNKFTFLELKEAMK